LAQIRSNLQCQIRIEIVKKQERSRKEAIRFSTILANSTTHNTGAVSKGGGIEFQNVIKEGSKNSNTEIFSRPSPEFGILIGESEASQERRGRRLFEPLSATANNADNDDSPAQSFVSEDGVLATAVFLVVVAQLTMGFHSHADCGFFMESGLNWNSKLANELYGRIELAFSS
jgi:hypothetical protein